MVVHFMREGEILGLYPEDGVWQLVEARAIAATDYYWHEGMDEWQPVWTRWPDAAPTPAHSRPPMVRTAC